MVPLQNGGLRLVFFLFLLVPGYVAVRAYLWANVTIDDMDRLTKLIWLSISGLGSLAGLGVLRTVGFPPAVWELFEPFVVSKTLSLGSFSSLTVLQATGVIAWQSVIAVISGVLIGALRTVSIDATVQRRRRPYLTESWDKLTDEAAIGDRITVVTREGDRITGRLEHIDHVSQGRDLVLTDPVQREVSDDDPIGGISYHHEQDISRVIVHHQVGVNERGWVSEKYAYWLQRLQSLGPDESETEEVADEVEDKAEEPIQKRTQMLRRSIRYRYEDEKSGKSDSADADEFDATEPEEVRTDITGDAPTRNPDDADDNPEDQ